MNSNTYTAGFGYLLYSKHQFTLQVLGWNNRGNPDVAVDNYSLINGNENIIKTQKYINSKENHNDLSFNYMIAFNDVHKLETSFNYIMHNSNTNDIIEEHYTGNTSNLQYDFDGKNKVFDAQLNYNRFNKDINLKIVTGAGLSCVSNNSASLLYSSSNILDDRFTYHYDFREITPAYFLNVSKGFNNISLSFGVRGEITDFRGNMENINVADTTYLNIFPNLNVDWKINKSNSLNVSYLRNIGRPSFENLSPNIRYDNIFSYREGNPQLLPTITDDISLSYILKKIRFNIGYRHKKNAAIFYYRQDDGNEDITVVKLINHKSADFLYAGGFYQFVSKRVTSSNSFRYTKPYATVRYNNGYLKLKRQAVYFKTSNDISLSDNISIFVDFLYNDLGESLLERKKYMYNLSAGISGSFLNKKILINISANDILDTYNFKDLRTYGFYDVIHEYMPDNTYLNINIRYNFKTGKQNYKVKNNSMPVLKRL
jgi:hypothetical protein